MELNPAPRLFLIPNILSDDNPAGFIPEVTGAAVHQVKQFIVEHEKSARALIKKLKIATPQAELEIRLWNEHSRKEDLADCASLFKSGDVGFISEAGLPCVADPGADIVKWAHTQGIRVVPLPGASSIFMALMASGFNGQSFAFHGYLPIEKPKRLQKIKELAADVTRKNQSQIFMEAPYRNNQLLEDILSSLPDQTALCIACEISSANEYIQTKSIQAWKKQKPDLHKKPVIFILG